jgi:hypothetical protein
LSGEAGYGCFVSPGCYRGKRISLYQKKCCEEKVIRVHDVAKMYVAKLEGCGCMYSEDGGWRGLVCWCFALSRWELDEDLTQYCIVGDTSRTRVLPEFQSTLSHMGMKHSGTQHRTWLGVGGLLWNKALSTLEGDGPVNTKFIFSIFHLIQHSVRCGAESYITFQ